MDRISEDYISTLLDDPELDEFLKETIIRMEQDIRDGNLVHTQFNEETDMFKVIKEQNESN